jgi:hypothetical protein
MLKTASASSKANFYDAVNRPSSVHSVSGRPRAPASGVGAVVCFVMKTGRSTVTKPGELQSF